MLLDAAFDAQLQLEDTRRRRDQLAIQAAQAGATAINCPTDKPSPTYKGHSWGRSEAIYGPECPEEPSAAPGHTGTL